MGVIQVSIKIEGDLKRKIEALKKHYKTQNEEELIKILVNEKAQQLKEATTNANQ